MARVTLKDIAREAGVSVMTVSNVVNGNLGRVSPATAREVERIVAARGYVPNGPAQSLAARRTRLVGLLLPDRADGGSLLGSPHDVAVAGAVEARLRERDHHLMLRGVTHHRDVLDSVQRWNLDGIVVMGFTDDELATLDLPRGVPAVVVDTYVDAPGAATVRADDFEGGRLAGEHLRALGHREVVLCGPVGTTSQVVRERLAGFRAGLGLDPADAAEPSAPDRHTREERAAQDVVRGEAGDGVVLHVVPANTTYDDGLDAAARVAASHPGATAVFATADVLAAGISRGLTQAGVRVPGEVSVVGFDDAEIARYVDPPLTTVAQDTALKGRTAADLLLDALDDGASRPRRPAQDAARDELADRPTGVTRIDVALVERRSTAAAP
ncbi:MULTISPECIES: LacI family DNA-binding transcriptional regulator [Cellulosimicrobium]|uniref:LacI family DNA-binding transcriptional regulator n=1 Tax=Cellulosimicrobium sp. ES-005 TaxID=3163031 RepID=A0AAU8FWU2_9MICO|nr:LacI family DNA-binding transcriptional regulator [Cellulosimicrobium cellulans]MCO7273501.1 LacI family transcriptional regulator [Cellulosimicrobium cellulans]